MEGTADARKVDQRFCCHKKRSRKVQWTYRKLMEVVGGCVDVKKVDGTSACHTESCQKVPRTHGKLTKVDGNIRDCTESSLKVTEGPTVARNVNGRFQERSKVHISLQKVPRTHEKWTKYPPDALKFDGRYCRCTKS